MRGTEPTRKAPISTDSIRAMTTAAPEHLAGLRDRALLLLGFAAGLRRSELVGLDVEDLALTAKGLLLRIGKSKGDRENAGVSVAVPRGVQQCPVAAVEQWLKVGEIRTGPLFRAINKGGHVSGSRLSDRSVADITKRYAERAGLDPRTISAHSLRAGVLTEAARRGASLPKLLELSRHRQLDTLRVYLRPFDLFAGHAAEGLL
jgi:site-specific recombinase XerD